MCTLPEFFYETGIVCIHLCCKGTTPTVLQLSYLTYNIYSQQVRTIQNSKTFCLENL